MITRFYLSKIVLTFHVHHVYKDYQVYVSSGGFDPLHVGHLRCIQESAEIAQRGARSGKDWKPGVLVVIVNGDGFLLRKKEYAFMPCEERMESWIYYRSYLQNQMAVALGGRVAE